MFVGGCIFINMHCKYNVYMCGLVNYPGSRVCVQ